jgi:predicted ATPase
MKQFACFQLDTRNECLWRNGERIPLTPKPFAVLRYLVENPQRLVTHDELLEALWPETYVQPQVLRTYVLELRKVFGDDADNARFIETVPKRGYRFISPVAEVTYNAVTNPERKPGSPQPAGLVGRAAELDEFHQAMASALQGERQVLFVTGEVGIGKTALVDAFCRQIADDPSVRIARGQSVEGFGGKEPYHPVTEALTQLCGEGGDGHSLKVLQQKAPNWHAKLPSVLNSEAQTGSPYGQHQLPAERMLGEICDAIEAMAAKTLLVLVFEDLHWADHSTLDLISSLARRRASARLMLVATYRPGDVSDAQHPLKGLKQDLLTRKLCMEIALKPLARAAVADYLAQELRQPKPPSGLTSFLHQHSEGNPLFMIAVLEHLMAQDYLLRENEAWHLTAPLAEIDLGVPTALSELIELQIERLEPAEQRLLEAASLIGVVFPAWAAAAALNGDLEEIEDQYEKLTRRLHFLHPAGHDELPDGTQSAFYVFAHGLYREALYKRQSASRRARRHLRVAEKLLRLFAGREQDVATELAQHFEAAGDWMRASEALMTVASNYLRRGDREEALSRMKHAARLLENLPEREAAKVSADIRKQIHLVDPAATEAISA